MVERTPLAKFIQVMEAFRQSDDGVHIAQVSRDLRMPRKTIERTLDVFKEDVRKLVEKEKEGSKRVYQIKDGKEREVKEMSEMIQNLETIETRTENM